MKNRITSLAIVVACLAPFLSANGAEACDSDGDIEFICGPISPEDLVAIPDSPWVVASSMIDEGYLHLVDTRDHSTSVAFPAPGALFAPDAAAFSTCQSPPSSQFRPHGLNIRPGMNGQHTLYVVGHGAREAVEVFTVDLNGSLPVLTWVGCVVAPEGVSLNSVTALPDGAFAVTNFNIGAGQLWEWQPTSGWAEVPGSTLAGPNGLVSSADGQWFYIGGWAEQSLVRLSRGQDPVQKSMVNVGFNIDNVRWAEDGSLLVAGQYIESMAAIGGCLSGGPCSGLSSRAARIDPETLAAQQLIDYPTNERFIMGTVTLQVGDEIWFGGIGGSNRIARFQNNSGQ